jgi:nucleoside-diphosphate-sugar epimerase
MLKKKILVIGGGGYVGSHLSSKLLDCGYKVTVYDLFIYGNNLNPHDNLNLVKGDIRDLNLLKRILLGHEIIIHLACISNDPSFDLNPELGKNINFDAFEPLVKLSIDSGVKHFVYASSSSVYGIKDEENTNEKSSLNPLTDYSRYKVLCEEILAKYSSDNFLTTILRPATVCGYSKRQRFDLVVNILTNHAFNNKKIIVLGGNQLRPNIHIDDMVQAYIKIIQSEKNLVNGQIFNVGFENKSVNDLADLVKSVVGANIDIINKETNDNRSYHISSNKIKETLNFKTTKTIKNAIEDLNDAFIKNKFINSLDNEIYFNIKRMKSINLK